MLKRITGRADPGGGIRNTLWVAFVMQVAGIGLATVLGVYAASFVLKDVLIKQALTDETTHYWGRLDRNPAAELPDTYNLTGYFLSPGGEPSTVPDDIRDLANGYHELPRGSGDVLVYVSEDPPRGRLYLVFAQSQVDALAFYFGAVPLVLLLGLIYFIVWFTYRVSRRAISPVIWLAEIVQRWDIKHPDIGVLEDERLPLEVQGEVRVLAQALHDFGSRIESFVERERLFTRDASHELRSPLTVMRIASDMLLSDASLNDIQRRQVQRIRSVSRDMEALIESFLILAREGVTSLPEEDFLANEVVADEMAKAAEILDDKPVVLRVEEDAALRIHASPRVLSVMLGNLLRNACNYTDAGSVTVRVGDGFIEVQDTGVGMTGAEVARAFDPFYRGHSKTTSGQGIGLSIVRRLSERSGWPVTLESTPEHGTTARISFPGSLSLPE